MGILNLAIDAVFAPSTVKWKGYEKISFGWVSRAQREDKKGKW
jgi:hypothetical protein